MSNRTLSLLASLAIATSNVCRGDEPRDAPRPGLPPPVGRRVDFARDIKPIFAEHCTKCHGAQKQLAHLASAPGPEKKAIRVDLASDGEHQLGSVSFAYQRIA